MFDASEGVYAAPGILAQFGFPNRTNLDRQPTLAFLAFEDPRAREFCGGSFPREMAQLTAFVVAPVHHRPISHQGCGALQARRDRYSAF